MAWQTPIDNNNYKTIVSPGPLIDASGPAGAGYLPTGAQKTFQAPPVMTPLSWGGYGNGGSGQAAYPF